ncbi:hypothetical protein RQ831_17750 [Roseomonas gilardii]|uniref:Uncharacterized protein n=1 Tax=Roseomonas gilardii TaxID=257708 RepID=A0ABU3MIR5_9PROT|nr:hypothetical protein [Roseomonas gilardii]MDT8332903.1 hypothetical protein [Roseomonas gilardii]
MEAHWMKYGYIYEKLMSATRSLATSDESLRVRLRNAYLAMHTLDHDETAWANDGSRDRYRDVVRRLTRLPDPQQGALDATLAVLTTDEMILIAEDIWALFLEYAYLDAEAQVLSDQEEGDGRPRSTGD